MTYQPPDDAAFVAAMEIAKARAEDKDRLERARAGLETGDGNAHDYLIAETDPITGERKKKGAATARLSALDIALQTESYRKLYEEVERALFDTQALVYDALTRAAEAVDQAKDALRDAEQNGADDEEIEQRGRILAEAREHHERLRENDRELADLQRRMTDEINPPDAEDLAQYRERISEIELEVGSNRSDLVVEGRHQPDSHFGPLSPTDNVKPIF